MKKLLYIPIFTVVLLFCGFLFTQTTEAHIDAWKVDNNYDSDQTFKDFASSFKTSAKARPGGSDEVVNIYTFETTVGQTITTNSTDYWYARSREYSVDIYNDMVNNGGFYQNGSITPTYITNHNGLNGRKVSLGASSGYDEQGEEETFEAISSTGAATATLTTGELNITFTKVGRVDVGVQYGNGKCGFFIFYVHVKPTKVSTACNYGIPGDLGTRSITALYTYTNTETWMYPKVYPVRRASGWSYFNAIQKVDYKHGKNYKQVYSVPGSLGFNIVGTQEANTTIQLIARGVQDTNTSPSDTVSLYFREQPSVKLTQTKLVLQKQREYENQIGYTIGSSGALNNIQCEWFTGNAHVCEIDDEGAQYPIIKTGNIGKTSIGVTYTDDVIKNNPLYADIGEGIESKYAQKCSIEVINSSFALRFIDGTDILSGTKLDNLKHGNTVYLNLIENPGGIKDVSNSAPSVASIERKSGEGYNLVLKKKYVGSATVQINTQHGNSVYFYYICHQKKPTLKKAYISNGQVTLKWDKVTNTKKYLVYRSTNKKSGYSYNGSTSEETYSDKGGSYGKEYFYKIVAVPTQGETYKSDYSNVLSKTKVPSKPSFTVKRLKHGRIKLTVTKNFYKGCYLYLRRGKKAPTSLYSAIKGKKVMIKLKKKKTYSIRLKSYAKNGGNTVLSAYSDKVTFKTKK